MPRIGGRGILRWVVVMFVLLTILVALTYRVEGQDRPVRHISIVTSEIKTKLPSGQTIEMYRWQPSTVIIRQGEQVSLDFYGMNGPQHAFEINGFDVRGVVEKGKRTEVTFVATKTGDYELRCLTHPDVQHHGPMTGFISVIQ